jgi:succinate dehydrogenase / fumarate reductase flavoprotein subunit
VRDLVTGEISLIQPMPFCLQRVADGNAFHLSTNAKGCNVTATWRAHRKGAGLLILADTQIHPTCIPVSGDDQSEFEHSRQESHCETMGRVRVPREKG